MDQTTSNPTDRSGEDHLLYDEDCPFCSAYVRMARLRQAGVKFALLDARGHRDLVRQYAAQGYDINEGMILNYRGRILFGSEVMNMLALMSTPNHTFNVVNRLLFSNPSVSRALYPLLRAGRNATLKLLGRSQVDLS